MTTEPRVPTPPHAGQRADEPREPLTFARGCAQLLACTLTFGGIIGVLRAGLHSATDPVARNLFFFPAHLFTAATLLLAGLVGVLAATSRAGAHMYLVAVLTLCATWAAAAFLLDGRPNDMFARSGSLIGVLLVVAATALAGLIWHRHTIPQAEEPPLS